MPCEHIDLGNGVHAIVCRPGTSKALCYVCGRAAPKLCDYPEPKHKSGTCDRPCCMAHCEHVGEDKDYCKEHAIATASERA